MPEFLHLVLGDSAAGSLRVACTSHSMPGFVFCIRDDLSHGPLHDGRLRVDYMRNCFVGFDDCWIEGDDAFAPWEALVCKILETNADTVVVWAGNNASEATFLCMACWWLREQSVRVLRPIVQSKLGRHYVATQPPAVLAELFPSAAEVSYAERLDQRDIFQRLSSDSGRLRHWHKGKLQSVRTDFHDNLLVACCSSEWKPAASIVGAAMGQCDDNNLMSDLFFASRFRRLIDKGVVDVNVKPERLRDYSVRLSGL